MNLINDIQLYKKRFEIFKTIYEGCKIGKYDNGDYYIVEPGYLQKFWRFYYSENRDNTWDYLDKDFSGFVKILDKITHYIEKVNFIKYIKYATDIIKCIDDLIPGLHSLKKTYHDTTKMVAKVDSIILTLIDFKENITKLRQKRNITNIARQKKHDIFRHSWEF